MDQTTKPSKYKVRNWLYKLLERKQPPPSPEEIRCQLGGWHYEPKNK